MYKKIEVPLYKKYVEEVVPALKTEFKIKNFHALPEIDKVVVNMGIRQAKDDKSVLEEALEELALITGQAPQVTRARKSISNFAVREGSVIGCRVTLRKKRMYAFLDRMLRIAIPRIRDFNGIKRSLDKFGNLTIGLKDESIFSEINTDKLKSIKGISVTIVTNRQDKEKSERMFELLGFPFIKVA